MYIGILNTHMVFLFRANVKVSKMNCLITLRLQFDYIRGGILMYKLHTSKVVFIDY